MSGGNLTYTHRDILINNLSAADFGVYTDSFINQKVLLFKKHGFALPYKDKAGTIVADVTKVLNKASVKRVALVLLNTTCPCESCNYEYGYSLEMRVKRPGILNSEYYPHAVAYGGALKGISCTGGAIDASELTKMRNDIIDQIANHVRYSPQGFDAVAEAAVARIFTFDNTKTIIINGVTINVTGMNIAQAIAAINAEATTLVKAYQLPTSIHASKIVLIGANGATDMTLGGTSVADANIYIGHTAKDGDITFEVKDSYRSISTIMVQAGSFSQWTPDDVARNFSQQGHHGHLLSQVQVEKPIPGEAYSIYVFSLAQKVNALEGANHMDESVDTVRVFVRNGAIAGDKWDASNFMWESTADNAGFAADTTFEELIGLAGATGWKS